MGALHKAHPRSRRTHCAKGHEYTPENTYVRSDRGSRECRTCADARRERHKQPREVTCPDCGFARTIVRAVRIDKRWPDGVCRTCANRRKAEFDTAVPIRPTSEHEAYWRSRFSQNEIDDLWAAVSLYLPLPLEQAA